MDFIAALYTFKIVDLSVWAVEVLFAVFGILTFLAAYLFLYKKDKKEQFETMR